MSQEQIVAPGTPQLPRIRSIWLAALMRPSVAGYARLGQQAPASIWRAYLWIFAGGLLGGVIEALVPFVAQVAARSYFDALLLSLSVVFSLIALVYVAAFTWCAQIVARLFKGSGTYRQLAYVFAAFSAPLMIVASILDVIPLARFLLIPLYIYWLALYVVAIRAVSQLSRMKAIAVVLMALLVLGLVWLGGAFLIGYSGVLLAR